MATSRDCVALRNRMMSRLADAPIGPVRDNDDLAAAPAPLTLNIETQREPAHDASSGNTSTTHIYASAMKSAAHATFMRERITDRGMRQMDLHEPTKDVYPHELPFPVRSTLEMERVAAPNSGCRSETLIMAAESAAVVRTLESQLHNARDRVKELENRLEAVEGKSKMDSTALEDKEKQVEVLAIRNEELSKQLELLRKECQTALEQKHKEHEEAKKAALASCEQEWSAKLQTSKSDFDKAQSAAKSQGSQQQVLTALVKELRDQLQQNAAAMQGHTQTIRQLSNDLLQAKCQASNLSCGLQEKEKIARQAKAELHANLAEMTKVREVASSFAAEKEQRTKIEAELSDCKQQLEALRQSDAERARLAQLVSKLEVDMQDKNRELLKLRGQVDVVRQQADQAYAHTAQFRGSTAAAAPARQTGDVSQLQREIEEEERRTADESRRWRQKQMSALR